MTPGSGDLLRRHGAHHRGAQHDHDELHRHPLVTVAWLLVGYSLAFSGCGPSGLIGGLSHVGMGGIGPDTAHGAVPELLYVTFQLSFAIITAALISGAIADRARFAAWMVFVPIWVDRRVRRCGALGLGARRLALRDWGCWTTRAGWSWRSSRGHRRWRWRWCWARASVSRSTRCGRTICRSFCWAWAAVVRLVRVQRRLGTGRQRHGGGDLPEHAARGMPGHAGLALGGTDPRRQADHLRRRLGRGGRTGGDHPVLRNGEHPRRGGWSDWWPVWCARSRWR